MYSPAAVPNILEFNPSARFVAMVRNPVEVVVSMHRHQCFNGNELERNLAAALDLNERRLAGEAVKVGSGYPADHLAYFHSCALGWQIRRLVQTVPQGQLHIVLYDDLRADPEQMLRGVLRFLELREYMPEEFRRINSAKERRVWWLDRITRTVGRMKSKSGIRVRLGILAALRKWNRRHVVVTEPPRALHERIVLAMRDDIGELETILGRELSSWSEPLSGRASGSAS
jgi:hypothetical protein